MISSYSTGSILGYIQRYFEVDAKNIDTMPTETVDVFMLTNMCILSTRKQLVTVKTRELLTKTW